MTNSLNTQAIRSFISSDRLKHIPITLHSSTHSTNNHLKAQSASFSEFPQIFLAEQQTHGKGQSNKTWYSPTKQNIYLSIAIRQHNSETPQNGLSLMVALSIIKALKSFGIHEQLQVKWPNDIFLSSKKLGGILVEMTSKGKSLLTIIGIGLNVNMQYASDTQIKQQWTSLYLTTRKAHNRNHLVALIIEQLFSHLDLFQQSGLLPFMEDWSSFDFLKNKEVTFSSDHTYITGIAKGINTKGALLLQTKNIIKAYSSGKICSIN